MDTATIKQMSTIIGRRVKVVNPEYVNGEYEGLVSGVRSLSSDEYELQVDHPEGSDAWEDADICELLPGSF